MFNTTCHFYGWAGKYIPVKNIHRIVFHFYYTLFYFDQLSLLRLATYNDEHVTYTCFCVIKYIFKLTVNF